MVFTVPALDHFSGHEDHFVVIQSVALTQPNSAVGNGIELNGIGLQGGLLPFCRGYAAYVPMFSAKG